MKKKLFTVAKNLTKCQKKSLLNGRKVSAMAKKKSLQKKSLKKKSMKKKNHVKKNSCKKSPCKS